jgi:cytidine deaminase
MKELLDREYEGFDPVRNYLESIPELTLQARRAAEEEGLSYREFHVGTAAKLLVVSGESVSTLDLSAANMKISPDDDKYCAEMNILDQTKNIHGRKQFVGLVTAGPSAPKEVEGVSGLMTATLHPCGACRERMMNHPRLFGQETLMLTVGADEDIAQIHTWGEIYMLWRRTGSEVSLSSDVGIPLNLDNWDENVELYDELVADNPRGVSKSYMARLAIQGGLQAD